MNEKLSEALATPMHTILAVRACFNCCENEEDILEVIGKIPARFGEFNLLMVSSREEYFMVQNLFERNGVAKSQIVAYDFYKEKECADMTLEEKLEMYNEKKRFIENVNEVFQMEPGCPSVEGVAYEVYTKDYGEGRVDIREWIVVHFSGGGKATKLVSGNSNIANFKVIGNMLAGGCYEEVQMYQEQLDGGYQRLAI